MLMWSLRAATAGDRLSLRWSGRPRPYTGRTTRKSWKQWTPPFPPRDWKARSCWRERTASPVRIPIWMRARDRRALHGMCLWPRLPPATWEMELHQEKMGDRQALLPSPAMRETEASQARAAARSRALREISPSSTKGAKAGEGIRTMVSAMIRNIPSSVPTTRMCSMGGTLRTSPWRLRRLTGKSAR